MDKDIRFTEKKVDAGWKEQIDRDKQVSQGAQARPSKTSGAAPAASSKPFMNLVTSLGYQALMYLGEIPNPVSQQREMNLEAAKETIDFLTALKAKTEGNLSAEELELFAIIPELQMKFAAKV